MNVFDLIIPAISQSLSGQNWLLGLIFAAVVTALIGLVIGWLWGRAWNAAWTPWASTLPTIVVSALMVVIFGSLLTLHGLTAAHFGFASLGDIPNQESIEGAIKKGKTNGTDAKKALENENLFTPAVEFCWNLADPDSTAVVAEETSQPQTDGDQQKKSAKELLEDLKNSQDTIQQNEQEARLKNMYQMLAQYQTAYYTVLTLFLSALVLMMLAIAALAYYDIKLIPVTDKLLPFCPEKKEQA